ncbi:hypothetical protein J4E93_003843 [Alternaria ventricosa]|uniref:uncharacterized protein n=1 Tax=Alternaria ventricosa TaxID=1187951 RepID=UPI0020C4C723|nr:uncharacterized protein J4E93_003843 [Alternaria ventricosa]KAI4649523.1 hypothetical protein J4E93_003843 [Alternaria ventricosa]
MTEEEWHKEKEENSGGDPRGHFIYRAPAAEDAQEANNAADDESDDEGPGIPYLRGFDFKRHFALDAEATLKVREALRTRWHEPDALTGFKYSRHGVHNKDFEGPFGWEDKLCRWWRRDA